MTQRIHSIVRDCLKFSCHFMAMEQQFIQEQSCMRCPCCAAQTYKQSELPMQENGPAEPERQISVNKPKCQEIQVSSPRQKPLEQGKPHMLRLEDKFTPDKFLNQKRVSTPSNFISPKFEPYVLQPMREFNLLSSPDLHQLEN